MGCCQQYVNQGLNQSLLNFLTHDPDHSSKDLDSSAKQFKCGTHATAGASLAAKAKEYIDHTASEQPSANPKRRPQLSLIGGGALSDTLHRVSASLFGSSAWQDCNATACRPTCLKNRPGERESLSREKMDHPRSSTVAPCCRSRRVRMRGPTWSLDGPC